ncbi:MAG: hypothetical protein DWQ37_10195 [Planctomycetota bacterium]|nr:MAG: hypothetical protein DWQ37_10195 [Planctomycetota bacterium]
MSDNPFQAPQTAAWQEATSSDGRLSHEQLRRVASDQRGILICILIYLCSGFGQFAVPPDMRLIPAIISLLATIAGVVYVFRLATKVYSTGTGIILGMLTFIPLIGLLVLLKVNGKATKVLREHGIEVGLLGAKASSI